MLVKLFADVPSRDFSELWMQMMFSLILEPAQCLMYLSLLLLSQIALVKKSRLGWYVGSNAAPLRLGEKCTPLNSERTIPSFPLPL